MATLGGSAIKTVANSEPTFVITGYSIDGEEITYDSEIVNKQTDLDAIDMVLAHNDEAPTIEIYVKNIGTDGTFNTEIYNGCNETGYPDWDNYENINIDIPSGETRSIVSKAENTGETICLWTRLWLHAILGWRRTVWLSDRQRQAVTYLCL